MEKETSRSSDAALMSADQDDIQRGGSSQFGATNSKLEVPQSLRQSKQETRFSGDERAQSYETNGQERQRQQQQRQQKQQTPPPDKLKSRLGQVKSLDGAKSTPVTSGGFQQEPTGTSPRRAGADEMRRSSVESARPASNQPDGEDIKRRQLNKQEQCSAPSSQRQIFSLKQMTLSKRRNLAGKKRASLGENTTTTTTTTTATAAATTTSTSANKHFQDQSTDSNSSETLAGKQANQQHIERRARARSLTESNRSSDKFEDSDSESNSDETYSEDEDEEDEEECEDEELETDEDQNRDAKSDRFSHCPGRSSGDECQAANMRISLTKGSGKQSEPAQSGRKRSTPLSARQRRRANCCNCEPIINRIDLDCQPVTDVDLASYKHLCQLEQKQQQLRVYQQWRARRNGDTSQQENVEPFALGVGYQIHRPHLAPRHQITTGKHKAGLNRRSSLQEESGAYYELCVNSEERQIRQKYVWFPPSLKTLQLVDQFFSYFARDKIPFNRANMNEEARPNTPFGSERSQQKGGVQRAGSLRPDSAPVCASYREEQIAFQLPRQDISLDYCSYPMSETSRLSYLQFVDKRNSQSLDVATVIKIKSPLVTSSTSSMGTTRQAVELQQQPPSRKMAAASQQNESQPVGQRCRRCLIRFEHNQMVVVAPNFAIGTGGLYHQPTRATTMTSPANVAMQRSEANLDSISLCSRRSSLSVQPQLIEDRVSPSLVSQAILSSQTNPTSCTIASGLQPTPTKPNLAMFHPNCFTCSTCREFLVDLVYCLRDTKLYCLRHYGESIRPRCNWCQELIFSDEYLKAMNDNFHVDHFLCRHCDSNLAGQRYVLKEEKPYCICCFEENFANTCEDCQKTIGIDSRDLSYKDRHWHDTCFVCQQCQQSLIDKPFGSKGDKVYCADCYDNSFATRCDGCKNPFRAGSKKMEYRGRQWHDSCFCCCVCMNTIGSNSFIPKNDDIYCMKCYEDKYATRCTKCKQVIVSGGVTFRNEPWHRECFNCCNCNKSLAGQRFTTKDLTNSDTNQSVNLNKTNQPHNAYCIDCYGELFAKKCFACSQAITGLGGTRFVTFEDRSWHNDCFICNDCQTSLVGKGFITDGPETILCGDCARAKLR